MEYSKLIHDFLDGTLDTQQENELFMMISSNDEVRAEFKHSLSLDKSLNKKLSSFAPSAKSTVGLFSQLGFTAPASLSGGPKPPGFFHSALRKYSQGMVGAASMAVVAVTAFLLMDTNGGGPGSQNNTVADNSMSNKIIGISSTQAERNIPVVESFGDELTDEPIITNGGLNNSNIIHDNIIHDNIIHDNIIHDNIIHDNDKHTNYGIDNYSNSSSGNNSSINGNYRNNRNARNINSVSLAAMNNPTDKINNLSDTQPEIENSYQNTLSNEIIPENRTSYLAYDISTSSAAAIQSAPTFRHAANSSTLGFIPVIDAPQYDDYIEPVGLSFAIHGNEYWQLQPKSLPESTIPKFSNMGLTVLYDVSDDLAIGIDVRQEHFYQEFTVAGDDDFDYLYQQTPNYFTFSGLVKYDFYEFDYVAFFIQPMAGMTATGGVGRFTAGVEYSPNQAYTFSLGFEGSVMVFKNDYDVKLYTAPKFGLNYSVIFRL